MLIPHALLIFASALTSSVAAVSPEGSTQQQQQQPTAEPLEHSYFLGQDYWFRVIPSTWIKPVFYSHQHLDHGLRFGFGSFNSEHFRSGSHLTMDVFHDPFKQDQNIDHQYPSSISTGGATTVSFFTLARGGPLLCPCWDASHNAHINHHTSIAVPLENVAPKGPIPLSGFWIRRKGIGRAELKLSNGALDSPLIEDIIQIKQLQPASNEPPKWYFYKLTPAEKNKHFLIAPECWHQEGTRVGPARKKLECPPN